MSQDSQCSNACSSQRAPHHPRTARSGRRPAATNTIDHRGQSSHREDRAAVPCDVACRMPPWQRCAGVLPGFSANRGRGLSPTCPGGRPAGESGQTTFALQDRPGLGEGSAPCPMPLVTCNDAPQAPAGQETFDSEDVAVQRQHGRGNSPSRSDRCRQCARRHEQVRRPKAPHGDHLPARHRTGARCQVYRPDARHAAVA